jgi:hypothetical protein
MRVEIGPPDERWRRLRGAPQVLVDHDWRRREGRCLRRHLGACLSTIRQGRRDRVAIARVRGGRRVRDAGAHRRWRRGRRLCHGRGSTCCSSIEGRPSAAERSELRWRRRRQLHHLLEAGVRLHVVVAGEADEAHRDGGGARRGRRGLELREVLLGELNARVELQWRWGRHERWSAGCSRPPGLRPSIIRSDEHRGSDRQCDETHGGGMDAQACASRTMTHVCSLSLGRARRRTSRAVPHWTKHARRSSLLRVDAARPNWRQICVEM